MASQPSDYSGGILGDFVLAANDPPFTPFGPPVKEPGQVVDVTPVPNIFSGQDTSMLDRYIQGKLLYEPQSLQTNGFYSGDYRGMLGSNYLDPTPMESRRPALYWRPPGLDK